MTADKQKVVKNTLYLYVRMAVTMLIGLFSVRIVLQALGEVDYGIYNVVAGIVTMLAFLNNSLSSATQRYLSIELGLRNRKGLNSIFQSSLLLYIIICCGILIVAETVGLWLVNDVLNYPKERTSAVNWIYQFSILSFLFSVLSAPYNATIIAHEKMNVFASITIVEAVCKLTMVIFLLVVNADKLILYGLMMMIISAAVFLMFYCYCKRHFEECIFNFKWDKKILKEIGAFAGWNIFGSLSNIFRSQGINIVLNLFFGAVANAARGISYQVEGLLNTFIQNFYIAAKPQIIKSWAEKDFTTVESLVLKITRVGYYLSFVLSLIFIVNSYYVLNLWLGQVPEHTVLFTNLMVISGIFVALSSPLMIVIHATGKIAKYQMIAGIINICVLPLSIFAIQLWHNSACPFIVLLIGNIFIWILTLERTIVIASFSLSKYLKVLFKMAIVSIITSCVVIFLSIYLYNGFYKLIVTSIVCAGVCSITAYNIDLNITEKVKIREILKRKVVFKKNKV